MVATIANNMKNNLYFAGAVMLGHLAGSNGEIASSLVFGIIAGGAYFIVSKFVESYKKK